MDLSILIAARNEMFLAHTIQDILDHRRGDTEVIVCLDGPGNPPIQDDPRVRILRHETPIGQRAGINECARASSAKYLMKIDAHCSVDEGFDLKLMQPYETGELGPDVTTIPRMYNLHVFDWQCKSCGNRTYQGARPTRCEKCKENREFEMVMVWAPRRHKRTDFARFDSDLHFQYWRDYEKREESKGDLAEVMCFVGAGFFIPRARYWELEGLDERHGSWGQMGVEISCKSWLSGGRMVVNKRTWFTHLFRTQPGFGFPYPNPGVGARPYSQNLWRNGLWPKAVHPLSWLVEKFAPVPTWENVAKGPKPKAGIVYYTDNRIDAKLAATVQRQIKRSANGHLIVSVSLEPIEFGYNWVLDETRGILTMFRQILLGLQNCDAEIVFLAEHDVLYHPSHFAFVPGRKDVFYYNTNTWKVDAATGRALHYLTQQTSGLCAYRELLIEHYRNRIARVEREGFSRRMGFEPGTHHLPNGVDNYRAESWRSPFPNIDIRHGLNLTPSRWSKDQFRSQRSCRDWQEAEEVPGWGRTAGRFGEFLAEVDDGRGQ